MAPTGGVRRPETALYQPGTVVRTKPAGDGGREYAGDDIVGIVLAVEDQADPDTGEKRRQFEVLDFRAGPTGLKVHRLAEAELDLAGAHFGDDRELRLMRRRVHRLIADRARTRTGKPQNPMTDSDEKACERIIGILWRAEQ